MVTIGLSQNAACGENVMRPLTGTNELSPQPYEPHNATNTFALAFQNSAKNPTEHALFLLLRCSVGLTVVTTASAICGDGYQKASPSNRPRAAAIASLPPIQRCECDNENNSGNITDISRGRRVETPHQTSDLHDILGIFDLVRLCIGRWADRCWCK